MFKNSKSQDLNKFIIKEKMVSTTCSAYTYLVNHTVIRLIIIER